MHLHRALDLGMDLSAFGCAVGILMLFFVFFVLQVAFGKRLGRFGSIAATAVSAGTVICAFLVFLISKDTGLPGSIDQVFVNWAPLNDTVIPMGLAIDEITGIMLLLVTGITFLVHLFSTAYIAGEEYEHRYWAFLALFAFAMCGLILADNLLLMFVFWELVGLASYFLIGFWFKKKKSAAASTKAFIVNRIGDAGFLVALLLIFALTGHFQFDAVISELTDMNYFMPDGNGASIAHWGIPLLIGLGLFLAAAGKSAQFPLQVWLPDAMAGPTPVSSLIHAATMVVAGVYLLIRCFPLFSPMMLDIIAVTGAFTAVIAAFSAISQTDIKRVLAYSTISQLGFMVMGIGVGAVDFAFFHLLTHAFFKCGLFLVAGAVIFQLHRAQHKHNLHYDAQDIRWMGGLGRKMPLVAICYMIFAAALAGLPFFSGFLSKDGLLIGALDYADVNGGIFWLVPGAALLASAFTAFYITRHGLLIFGGKFRAASVSDGKDIREGLGSTPWAMIVPLTVLAAGSFWVLFSPGDPFHAHFQHEGLMSRNSTQGSWLPWLFTGIAVIGIAIAAFVYRNGPLTRERYSFSYNLSLKHLFLDQIYQSLIVTPFLAFSRLLASFDRIVVDGAVHLVAGFIVRKEDKISLSKAAEHTDRRFIDRVVNGVAAAAMRAGQNLRGLQSGRLQLYIIYTLLGLLLLLLALFYFVPA